jgi:hypothetical protein
MDRFTGSSQSIKTSFPGSRLAPAKDELKHVADVGPEYRAAMEAGAGLELAGDLLLATSAHAAHHRRIGPTDARALAEGPDACKHESGHDGVDTTTAARGVMQSRALAKRPPQNRPDERHPLVLFTQTRDSARRSVGPALGELHDRAELADARVWAQA